MEMYLAEMDLVEDDLVGVADAPEPGQEGESSDKSERDFIIPFRSSGGLGLRGGLRDLVELDV